MSKTKWIWLVVVIVLVIVAIIWWPKGERSTTSEGAVIKIGVIAPLTGDAAVYGVPVRNMITMAIEEINKDNGINGKKLEAIYEDGKCNGKDAVTAAQKLINVDGVKIILGGFCSGESLAAVPVAEAGKAVLFSSGSSSPELTGKSAYFFRNYPSDASQGKVLADYASSKGWKNVSIIQEQSDYAVALSRVFSENFDGQVIKEEFPTQPPILGPLLLS